MSTNVLTATRAFAKKLADMGIKKQPPRGLILAIEEKFEKIENNQRHKKFGVIQDDFYLKMHPHVKEALRRLPREVYYERGFRLHRANLADAAKGYLNETDHTTEEDDKIAYLSPLVDLVELEELEKDDWLNGRVKI